jgi:hypothetical protein
MEMVMNLLREFDKVLALCLLLTTSLWFWQKSEG